MSKLVPFSNWILVAFFIIDGMCSYFVLVELNKNQKRLSDVQQ
jgi:HAMP domain-containing protein